MKRSILLVLLGLFCLSFVFATNVQISPSFDLSNEIYKDEVAEFNLVIRNDASYDEQFLIYSIDPRWIIYSEESQIVVPSNSEKSFKIFVDPTSAIVTEGIYQVDLNVKSTKTGKIYLETQTIVIKNDDYRTVAPAVSIIPKIYNTGNNYDDTLIDPREEVNIRILLRNRNALDIPKLNVFVQDKYYETTFETAVSPNGEIIKVLSYNMEPFSSPGNDTLKVQIYYDGELINDKRMEYEVQENRLFFTRDSTVESKFMYTSYSINLTNNGNVKSVEEFNSELGWFKKLFTDTVPESSYNSSSNQLYFKVELAPGESTIITITTDYRATFYTLVVIALIIGLVLFVYYKFRSPILVTKKATIVDEKDGGTSEIKILMNIKNRTNKILENIVVLDRIPDITEIEEEFTLGTLKPTKIVRNHKKGTLIKWEFSNIEGFEERLITYRIHSKLGILGDLSLPSTIVQFELPDGKRRAVKSKSVDKI